MQSAAFMLIALTDGLPAVLESRSEYINIYEFRA